MCEPLKEKTHMRQDIAEQDIYSCAVCETA